MISEQNQGEIRRAIFIWRESGAMEGIAYQRPADHVSSANADMNHFKVIQTYFPCFAVGQTLFVQLGWKSGTLAVGRPF
jgi:hypothetical protein